MFALGTLQLSTWHSIKNSIEHNGQRDYKTFEKKQEKD